MGSITVRSLLPALAVTVVATGLAVLGRGEVARAVPQQVQLAAIDTNITGNDDTVIGPIDGCGELANVGDSLTFDLVVKGVDNVDRIKGYQFDIDYNPNIIQVVGVTDVDSSGSNAPNDVTIISRLVSSGGVGFLSLTDTATNPSSMTVAAADGTNNPAPPANHESGDGVLARVTVQAVGVGTSPLLIPSQQGGQDGKIDTIVSAGDGPLKDGPIPVATLQSGAVAVGEACPAVADVAVSSVVTGSPASADLSTPFTVTADVQVSNNGPEDAVNVDTTIALTVPTNCATSSPNPVTVQNTVIAVGSPASLPQQSWSLTCGRPGSLTFTATATAVIDAAAVSESDPSNNVASGASATQITGQLEADFGVDVVTLTAPGSETAGSTFSIAATATIHNAGPLSPTDADVTLSLTLPSDCAVGGTYLSKTYPVLSVKSSPVVVPSPPTNWLIACQAPGLHTFQVTATVEPFEPGVVDPALLNNSASVQKQTNIVVGICGDDPAPAGEPLTNPSPLLLQTIINLSAGGDAVPAGQELQLDCFYDLTISDNDGAPIDDCQLSLPGDKHPCSLSFPLGIDEVGGTPPGDLTTVRLNPIGVNFLAGGFDIAGDLDIPNGATVGSADFRIRTDGGLFSLGAPCSIDAILPTRPAVEGGILPNVPDSNSSADITNPYVWPNDMNGEIDAVISALTANPALPPVVQSRSVVPLSVGGVNLPLTIIVFRLEDPSMQSATGARWVVVGFPGDPVNPDPPGPSGGDPDADDGAGATQITCSPYSTTISLDGAASSGETYVTCVTAGNLLGWSLIDPDASNFTKDQGPRSDTSPCSEDADGDGLTANEEAYYGTNPLDTDSDDDGVLDKPDNCKLTPNPGQENLDGDDLGDACDPDIDGDNVDNVADNCVTTYNPAQQNNVHPGTPAGDHCEDPEPDGVYDINDNCPDHVNPGQQNNVHPGTPAGDHCEDPEPDGVYDINDNCPDHANPGQQNNVHPATPLGDHCEDPEPDGVFDAVDNCPDVANPGQQNADGDAWGDACDNCPAYATPWLVRPGDTDCDGFSDADEALIGTDPADACGVDAWPADFDNDHVINITDLFNVLLPHFGTLVPPTSPRRDLLPDGVINISDVFKLMPPTFASSCS